MSDSDLVLDKSGPRLTTDELIIRRLGNIKIIGPLLSISFILFWIPILPLWGHFVIGICLYDSFLTIVDLNLNSLLADISITVDDRTALSRSRSVGNICASISVFMSYAIWDQVDLVPFKVSN